MRNKKRFLWILLPVAALLSSCQGSPFSDEDITAKIFPNGYWDFLIQLIAFVILLLIVFFLGYKPLKKMMAARHDKIQAMIQDAEENQRVAHNAAMAAEETIEEGRQEAERILESARAQAKAEGKAIIAAAEEEAASKRRKAQEDIAAAEEASRARVREEIIDVAMLASETLLGREVNSEDNARLVETFVDSISGEGEGEPK